MFVVVCVAFLQDESRILRVKVIAGIGLAKKDILGARSVYQILYHQNDTITSRAVQLITCDSHAHLVSKAGVQTNHATYPTNNIFALF